MVVYSEVAACRDRGVVAGILPEKKKILAGHPSWGFGDRGALLDGSLVCDSEAVASLEVKFCWEILMS